MIRFLTLKRIVKIHGEVLAQSGGLDGIRDLAGLESATAQPKMTFSGKDLYPTLPDKAGALGFSLICNHPFIDGNKRVGHAAMDVFLRLNGFKIQASVDDQEQIILHVAAGQMQREAFCTWLHSHVVPLN